MILFVSLYSNYLFFIHSPPKAPQQNPTKKSTQIPPHHPNLPPNP